MSPVVYIPFFIYLISTLSVSVWASRYKTQSTSLQDYFVGNRKINSVFLAMTLVATYLSASTFIGGPGAAYTFGLGWVLLALIQLPTLWLTLSVVGHKIARIGKKINALTLNDLIWARYQSKPLLILCVCTLLLAFFAMIVVQFIGGARLLETVAHIPYQQGLLLFAGITLIYTAFGGFRAVVWTDVLQGSIMLLGTLVLLGAVLCTGGGFVPMLQELEAIDPKLLTPRGANDFLSFPFMLSFWVLIAFGAICLPHSAARCLSVDGQKSLRKTIIIGTVMSAIMLVALNVTGVLGRVLIPDLEVKDKIIPELIMQTLPLPVAGLLFAVPLAAIMSTVDSLLLQTSATLIKDLMLRFGSARWAERVQTQKIWSRGTTLALGLLATLAASTPPDMIIWLNLMAMGTLEAVFLWPMLCGLYWHRANATGALLSAFCGLISYIGLMSFDIKIAGLHAVVPALAIAGVGMWCGSFFSSKRQPVTAAVFFEKSSVASTSMVIEN